MSLISVGIYRTSYLEPGVQGFDFWDIIAVMPRYFRRYVLLGVFNKGGFGALICLRYGLGHVGVFCLLGRVGKGV